MVLSCKLRLFMLSAQAAVSLADVPEVGAPVQMPVPEKWNEEGIAKLTASAGKLLQTTKDGNLVTPVVADFAHQTIQEIEQVIATIEDEAKIAKRDLDEAYARFTEQEPNLEHAVGQVSAMNHDVSGKSTEHETCRQEQVPLMHAEEACRQEEARLKIAYEADEAALTSTYHSIKGRWCPNEYDEMDEDFFASNENDMQMYIEEKERVKESKRKYTEKKDECAAAQEARELKQTSCDVKQDELEFKACEFGIGASGVNQHMHTVWSELTTEYAQIVTDLTGDAEDRQKEFIGVTIVKCLLQKIEENQLAGMPCNETHAGEVNAGIDNCHNQDIDVAHLQMHPQSAPPMPDGAEHPNIPCVGAFMDEHYAQLASEVVTEVRGRCSPCAMATLHED
jgi:hypothetical protein